jgi:hypothetical protein
MILKYGLSKSNTYVPREFIENDEVSGSDNNEAEHKTACSKEFGEIEIIPMGPIIQ